MDDVNNFTRNRVPRRNRAARAYATRFAGPVFFRADMTILFDHRFQPDEGFSGPGRGSRVTSRHSIMRQLFRLASLLALATCAASAAGPAITVVHEQNRRELDAADLAALPRVEIEALDHGEPRRYRGVAVRDVLALVGAPLGGNTLRGRAVALAVRVRAADGYVAAFALAEFDPAFREKDILLVDRQDGEPLPDQAGPFRLVCPGDQRGARWVRQVVSIEIVSLATGP